MRLRYAQASLSVFFVLSDRPCATLPPSRRIIPNVKEMIDLCAFVVHSNVTCADTYDDTGELQ